MIFTVEKVSKNNMNQYPFNCKGIYPPAKTTWKAPETLHNCIQKERFGLEWSLLSGDPTKSQGFWEAAAFLTSPDYR